MNNDIIAEFKNSMGTVKLSKLANVYMVSAEPRYGENVVNSFYKQKKAEIDYSYYVNIFSKGA